MSVILNTGTINNGTAGAGVNTLGEFILRLAIQLKGNGRVITKDVTYMVVGPPTATAADVEEAGMIYGGRIAKMSGGVVMGFFKKLGKYRNDEAPKQVAGLKKEYGVIFMSNNPKAEDADSSDPLPWETKTAKLFIPWIEEDVSRQDMRETIKAAVTTGGLTFNLGTSRFATEDKDTITAYPMEYVAGLTVKEYGKAVTFELTNTDAAEGGSDFLLSEAPSSIVEGDDDQ